MLCVRTALCLAFAVAACSPEGEGGPYVAPDSPIETEAGLFTLSLRAAEGNEWPEVVGSTVVALRVDDPQGDGAEPEAPLELALGAVGGRVIGSRPVFSAKAWRLTPDGFRWLIALTFRSAGEFALPLTIRDGLGREDAAVLRFHVEAE